MRSHPDLPAPCPRPAPCPPARHRHKVGPFLHHCRISIYAGNVVLKNLQLKAEALADLDLPVTVKAGLLGTLTLKVPWSNLGRVPVEVTIDRLYILAAPKAEAAAQPGASGTDPADVDAAYQLAKLQRAGRQESRWVDELEQMETRGHAGQQPGDAAAGGGGGFLRGLIDTIVGNLQLSITNVHVRYEDDVTHRGHPFAFGLTLERVSGYTVDEAGREAFVTNSPLELLRKALQLRRIAVYFDCDATGWDPWRPWAELPPYEWDRFFQPGIAAESQQDKLLPPSPPSSGAEDAAAGGAKAVAPQLPVFRQYVLQPVDGRATYVRRGRNVKRSEDEPAAEFDFALDVVAVSLSQAQYQSYSLLLAEVSVFTARVPQSGYRPRGRPAAGAAARMWWRYAALAVGQQLAAHKLTLRQVVRFAKMRRQYVPMYVQYVNARQAEIAGGGKAAPELAPELVKMDAELPENTILMFRRLAYAEVQRERRRAAKVAAEAAAAGEASKVNGGRGRGWLGWLVGSRPSGGGSPQQGQQAGASGADEAGRQRADLSPEEYNRLIELMSQQEEGLKLGERADGWSQNCRTALLRRTLLAGRPLNRRAPGHGLPAIDAEQPAVCILLQAWRPLTRC